MLRFSGTRYTFSGNCFRPLHRRNSLNQLDSATTFGVLQLRGRGRSGSDRMTGLEFSFVKIVAERKHLRHSNTGRVSSLASTPQERLSMPPNEAFWKALALTAITNIVVWGAIWYWIGPNGDDWSVYLTLFSLSFLMTLLAAFRRYRKGNAFAKWTSRRHGLSAVLWGCLGAAWVALALLNRHSRWHIAWRLALAVLYCAMAVSHLRKALLPEATPIAPK